MGGAAAEYEGKGITGHSLWPATVIESQAALNFDLGDKSIWRKASILADCVLGLVSSDKAYTGKQLIDDEYLTEEHGFTAEDLAVYRYDPEVEPPRVLAQKGKISDGAVRQGDVRKLSKDKDLSSKL